MIQVDFMVQFRKTQIVIEHYLSVEESVSCPIIRSKAFDLFDYIDYWRENVAGSDQSDIMKNPGAMEYQGILIRLVSLVVDSIIPGMISLALVVVTGIQFVSSTSSPTTPWTFNIIFW